jgi:pseudouridine-5'-phosphate glycosidase
VFATGGIGGVHPAEEGAGGYDVSADLLELSRTKIVVVSAGAKSILDLPATLEVLETYSVPVVGYQTKEFPAFHSRESGLFLSHMAQDLDELSELVRAHFNLDLLSAFLVCNPVPEHAAMEPAEIKTLIEAARQEAIVDGIKGPAMTPYILAAINRLSHGKTSDVNKALGLNNAVLAARLASRLV